MRNFIVFVFFFAASINNCLGLEVAKIEDKFADKTMAQQAAVSSLINSFYSKMPCLTPEGQAAFDKKKGEYANKFIPPGMSNLIEDIANQQKYQVNNRNLTNMMHLFSYTATGAIEDLPGSDTYTGNAIDPRDLLDKGRTNFIYSLDCSGYVAMLASVKAGISSAQIQTEIQNSIKFTVLNTMIRGQMTPLLNKAIQPGEYGALKYLNAVPSILFSLINKMINDGKTEIIVPKYIEVVSYASSGTNRLQGQVNGAANGSAAFGVGSANMSASSGFAVTQSFEFVNPKSIVIASGDNVTYSLDVIKQKFAASLKSTLLNVSVTSKYIEVLSDLQSSVCIQPTWNAKFEKDGTIFATETDISDKSINGEGKCSIKIRYADSEAKLTLAKVMEPNVTIQLYPSEGIFSQANLDKIASKKLRVTD